MAPRSIWQPLEVWQKKASQQRRTQKRPSTTPASVRPPDTCRVGTTTKRDCVASLLGIIPKLRLEARHWMLDAGSLLVKTVCRTSFRDSDGSRRTVSANSCQRRQPAAGAATVPANCTHFVGFNSRQVIARTCSKAFITSLTPFRLIAPAWARSWNPHHELDRDTCCFEGFRVGNEVGVCGGVGHGHLRVVHALTHKPVWWPMSRMPCTLPVLDIGRPPATPSFERPGGGHFVAWTPDRCR